MNHDLVRSPEGSPGLAVGELGRVAAMRLFPGFSASILANLCRPPLRGLVIEAYGAGNGPSEDREFLAAIEAATAAGIVVVVVTQCVRGSVQPGAYATGIGVVARGRGAGLRHDVRGCADQARGPARSGPRRRNVAETMQRDVAGELSPRG